MRKLKGKTCSDFSPAFWIIFNIPPVPEAARPTKAAPRVFITHSSTAPLVNVGGYTYHSVEEVTQVEQERYFIKAVSQGR